MTTTKETTVCKTCNGTKLVVDDYGGQKACHCTLKEQALRYLGDTYKSSKWIKTFNPKNFEDQSIYVENIGVDAFKTFIKSFLLTTGMKYTHKTVTGGEIAESYFDRDVGISPYTRPDLLVLILGRDGKTGAYKTIIPSLLSQRQDIHNKMTFIYTYTPLDSFKFKDAYGQETFDCIHDSFSPVKLK